MRVAVEFLGGPRDGERHILNEYTDVIYEPVASQPSLSDGGVGGVPKERVYKVRRAVNGKLYAVWPGYGK